MAYRAKQPAPNGSKVQFPPEACGDFDVVAVEKIEAWRNKLNERFGIGQGKLRVVQEVVCND
ncbi:hypothetical protein [Sulfitobacter sp. EhC04]|uniref:hypothetical protein n=1 Tax=Sulfitobacter sp. EhC04 TaxID=1849168 RepID=UPI0010FE7238|nr:hypothetical protein [Sulfitobacter sp. EhC04]